MSTAAHTESDYIPYVFGCLLENDGNASFADIRDYIEERFQLNRQDRVTLPSLGCPRWHQRLRNLKSNKTMMSFPAIREVLCGFKLTGVRRR